MEEEENKVYDGGSLPEFGPNAYDKDRYDAFYYNKQLYRSLLRVSIHVNSETSDGGITWTKVKSEGVDDEGYTDRPIFSALLSEEFQTAISNSWSEFGGDAIGDLFSTFKPYAPYLQYFADRLGEMISTSDEMKASGDEAMNSRAVQSLVKLTEIIKPITDNSAKLLNRNLIAQGARFSYYSGTGVGFGNLGMKFTVFADWVEGKFKTVNDQLEELYPYCFGKFADLLDEEGNITGTDVDTSSFISSGVQSMANEFFKWQLPPAGFEAVVKDVDICQFGTIKLKFGSFYSLDNLVISDANFNFSRQMVKNWDGESNDISPLYCDVSLTFKPASKFTDDKLLKFVSGKSMESEISTTENYMNKRLGEEQDKISSFLSGE